MGRPQEAIIFHLSFDIREFNLEVQLMQNRER